MRFLEEVAEQAAWNPNDSIAVLAALVAAIAAAISAATAVVAIRRSKQEKRSALFLSIDPTSARRDPNDLESDSIIVDLHNNGAAKPIRLGFQVKKHAFPPSGGGANLDAPEPGSSTWFPVALEIAQAGFTIEIAWTDQDGKNRSFQRFYRLHGDRDDAINRRSDLAPVGKLQTPFYQTHPLERKAPRMR